MTEAPTLPTARLTLRPHRMADFPDFAAFFASDASRYVGGPMPERRAWAGFAADVGSWDLLGFGAWGVEESATGAFVGQVALAKPPFFPERELGWIVFPAFQRRGYGAEAARAARDFAYDALGWETAVSYVDPENAASMALAERLGATIDPQARSFRDGDLVYRHPEPERLA